MSVSAALRDFPVGEFGACRHPNEVDCMRIARALEKRQRYRYVSPTVVPVKGGYLILSPCCSRNVDEGGGVIEIALLVYLEQKQPWLLHRKDHQRGEWVSHSTFRQLDELMDQLNEDPDRVFWQ